MLTLTMAGRRPAGQTLAAHHDYMLNSHGRIVTEWMRANPAEAARRYVQNHAFDAVYRAGDPGVDRLAIARDFVTRLWFDDQEHVQRALSTEQYLTVFRPDESNFVDQSTVVPMPTHEVVVRPRTDPDARYKLIVLHTAGQPDQAPALVDEVSALWAEGLGAATSGATVSTVLTPPADSVVHIVSEGLVGSPEECYALLGLWTAARDSSEVLAASTSAALLAVEHVLIEGP